jgi:hypothetical protein
MFFENYLFEMSKFKETTREGKIQKLVKEKPRSFLVEADPCCKGDIQ